MAKNPTSGADSELAFSTIAEVAARIRSREISPVELTTATLARIDQHDSAIRAYLEVFAEDALEAAGRLEREIVAGHCRGPLHGVPVGIKALFAIAGEQMSCASPLREGLISSSDATVVSRLRDAGAIIVGTLNMTEFAFAGYHPSRSAPSNPWDARRWPGLSSSGSGAATAAGFCYAALGTDTGGSIRFPAAANGVVGIKPTFGRVSRRGVFPLSHTLDHVGTLARGVGDAALILSIIAGHDDRDPFSADEPLSDYVAALDAGVQGLRVGVDERYVDEYASSELATALLAVATVLEGEGAVLQAITMPKLAGAGEAWPIVCAVDAAVAHRKTFPQRAEDYGQAMRGLLELGINCDARDYAAALIERARIGVAIERLFDQVDVVLSPALSAEPPLLGERTDESDRVGASFLFAAPYNLSGSPSLTLRCGVSSTGMPLSLQLIGGRFAEATLIAAARAYERVTNWHLLHPDL